MKRLLKMWLFLMLIIMMGLSEFGTLKASSAGEIIIKQLSPGKTAKGKDYYSSHIVYKIVVKKDGYLTITNNHYMKEDASICITTSKPKTNESGALIDSGTLFHTDESVHICSYPVKKGTYYLYASPNVWRYNPDGEYNEFSFKYTFTAVKSIKEKNYCWAQAITLKTKKTAVICAPRGYNYYRWYRIDLKKKKRLNINFVNMMIEKKSAPDTPDFTIFNADFSETIQTVHGDGFNYSTVSKLPKGTYYIRVDSYSEYHSARGWQDSAYLYKLSWK